MSGREALKGFRFQTNVMLLCFLEHCARCADFYMLGEPAKNLDTGNFVDIDLVIKDNGRQYKKSIQVKKTINSGLAIDVINTLIQYHLTNSDQVELWFTDYVLQNKMEILDAYDKLIEAINIPGFAEREIQGKLGTKEITISVDGNVADYSFISTSLKLHGIEVLDDAIFKAQIADKIALECGENKKYVISKIKNYLNDTLVYRRHRFLDELAVDPTVREEIIKKDYEFFNKIIIRRIGEDVLLLKIKELIPSPFTTNQKEILQDVLFSFFFKNSSDSQKIEMSDVNARISGVAREFRYKMPIIINWSSKSIHGAFAPSLMPTGDFSMGGQQ